MAPTIIYRPHDPVPQDMLSDLDPLTRQLLWSRGIRDEDTAAAFLSPDYDTHLHDPFLLTDMDRAVPRVLQAVRDDERVAIYSDYDCDGIPGGVVLHDFFNAVGSTNFENYIPHRHDEGFGFSEAAVKKLHERGVSLIITVDCGTADAEAVTAAKACGIDVIIADHHEPNGTLPDAFAFLNPKRDEAYPFRELCGAGVAYKLVQALIQEGRKEGIVERVEGWEKWLLDMVGIATVADMVPLVGENRALAHYGLQVLRKSRRPGLQHLLRKARASQRHLTEDDIGFLIGPRINAASRMDTPEDAFHLLATTDEGDAGTRVQHLEKLNNERKGIVASMSKELKKRIERMTELPEVIVIGNPEWKPALVGLAANSLSETYKRPVFLWGRDGQGIIKGSCRSDGEVSVVALMEAAKDAFIEFGGHHGSGGFSVADEKIHSLTDALNDAYRTVVPDARAVSHEVRFDTDLSLDEINDALLASLRALAPYGEGNPKPIFRFQNVSPSSVEAFGKGKDHLRLVFDTSAGRREAIAFFKTADAFQNMPEAGTPVTLIAHVEESFFMNKKDIRLRIVEIL